MYVDFVVPSVLLITLRDLLKNRKRLITSGLILWFWSSQSQNTIPLSSSSTYKCFISVHFQYFSCWLICSFLPISVIETILSTSPIAIRLISAFSIMKNLYPASRFPSCLKRISTYGKYWWVANWDISQHKIKHPSLDFHHFLLTLITYPLFHFECTLFRQKFNEKKITKFLQSTHKAYVTVIT